jgi:hypothetical protein
MCLRNFRIAETLLKHAA